MPEQKAVASARWPSLSRTPASGTGRYTSATRLRPSHLLLSQQQIDDPTATYMRARLSQMGDDLLVGAAGVFEGVGQDRKTGRIEGAGGQAAALVGGPCQT